MKHNATTEKALHDLVGIFMRRFARIRHSVQFTGMGSTAGPSIWASYRAFGRLFTSGRYNDLTKKGVWVLIPAWAEELVPTSVVVPCASRLATRGDL